MRIEIINIGSELLEGMKVNTNLSLLASLLYDQGQAVKRARVVGDDEEEIVSVLRDSLYSSDLIICTGGLGPTVDDVTRRSLLKFLDSKLVVDKTALKHIEKYYRDRGIEPSKQAYNQAMVPRASKVLYNKSGCAPGFIVEEKNKFLLFLPGVPAEAEQIFRDEAVPYLRRRFGGRKRQGIVFRVCGLSEIELSEKLFSLQSEEKGLKFSFLPGSNEIILKVESGENASAGDIQKAEEEIKRILGDFVYGTGAESLEEVVGLLLTMRKKKIALAESCTGGLLGYRLTKVAGSSEYFAGGIVAYDNEAKEKILSVPKEVLSEHGAVSSQTAAAMAVGARRIFNSDVGLAVTGIAGPGGAVKEKKRGLVFVALAIDGRVEVREFCLAGSREVVRENAGQQALNLLRLHLIKK